MSHFRLPKFTRSGGLWWSCIPLRVFSLVWSMLSVRSCHLNNNAYPAALSGHFSCLLLYSSLFSFKLLASWYIWYWKLILGCRSVPCHRSHISLLCLPWHLAAPFALKGALVLLFPLIPRLCSFGRTFSLYYNNIVLRPGAYFALRYILISTRHMSYVD